MGAEKYQNDGNPPVTSGPGFALTLHESALVQPYTWGGGRRVVFVNSMSDLFHARVPLDFVRRVFDVIRDTPQHTYQVLTKRSSRLPRVANQLDWPANLWMGVSIENEEHLYRVEHLREVPAAVRFLSCEPLLGPLPNLELSGIDWVITGGESGPGARPLDLIGCARSATSAERPTCPSSTSNGVAARPRPADGRSTGLLGVRCRGHSELRPDDLIAQFLRLVSRLHNLFLRELVPGLPEVLLARERHAAP